MINHELLREQKYQRVLRWLRDQAPRGAKVKHLNEMLLRYVFNLSASDKDDPVFITTSVVAQQQFHKDILSFGLGDDARAVYLTTELVKRFKQCAREMAVAQLPLDDKVTRGIQQGKAYLLYGGRKLPDLRDLGRVDAAAAFALQLRYNYLQLNNHGLARLYTDSPTDATEAFAHPFNRYYQRYCSFFPDLERRFGSLGSFFQQTSFSTPTVQLNPPFDQTLMARAFEHVYQLLESGATNRFVFTVPNWSDFPELERLQTSEWTRSVVRYAKGDLLFIDHASGCEIAPCPIVEVTLSGTWDTPCPILGVKGGLVLIDDVSGKQDALCPIVG